MNHIIVSSNDTKSLRFPHLIIIISKTLFWFKDLLSYILMSKINKNLTFNTCDTASQKTKSLKNNCDVKSVVKKIEKIENEKKLKNNYIEDNELNIKMEKNIEMEKEMEAQMYKVLYHRCSEKLKNQPFMKYYDDDKNRSKIEEYNKKVFLSNCKMIVDADTKKTLKGIFKLEKSRDIMKDFIFDLLDYNQHYYYKKMRNKCDKMMFRCEYDDIPDEANGGITKEDNRELIQNQIEKFRCCAKLNKNGYDYMELLQELLMKIRKPSRIEDEDEKPQKLFNSQEECYKFSSKEEAQAVLEYLDDENTKWDKLVEEQEIDDKIDEYITNVDDYTPVEELPPPVDELTSEECEEDKNIVVNEEAIKNLGDIDGKRYYSNVDYIDMAQLNELEEKKSYYREKADKMRDRIKNYDSEK
jgi:hypothetical protein